MNMQRKVGQKQTEIKKMIHKFIKKTNQEVNYFIAGPHKKADMAAYPKTTLKLHSKYIDIFSGIGCLKGTLS